MPLVRDNPATILALVLLLALGTYTLLTATNILLGLVLPAILIVPAARFVDGRSADEADEDRPRK